MAKIKLEFGMDESVPCYHCGESMPSTEAECPSCGEEVPTLFNVADVFHSFYEGHILDARAGGLVLGRHDNEDDIPMLAAIVTGVFQVIGMMQGGEYILNREAAAKHRERLEEINSYKSSEYTPMKSIEITDRTRVFNTNGIKGNLAMFIDRGQFIVNRAATIKHYLELEEFNNSVIHELTEP